MWFRIVEGERNKDNPQQSTVRLIGHSSDDLLRDVAPSDFHRVRLVNNAYGCSDKMKQPMGQAWTGFEPSPTRCMEHYGGPIYGDCELLHTSSPYELMGTPCRGYPYPKPDRYEYLNRYNSRWGTYITVSGARRYCESLLRIP